jgi:hypothetical protein
VELQSLFFGDARAVFHAVFAPIPTGSGAPLAHFYRLVFAS